MEQKERNPPMKVEIKQVGNTLFTVKSVESKCAKQSIKSILKKMIENKH
ncbi:hypothetical protein [Clostridium perfringens]